MMLYGLYLEANEITDKNAKEYIEDAIYGIEKNKEEIIKYIKENLSKKGEIEEFLIYEKEK